MDQEEAPKDSLSRRGLLRGAAGLAGGFILAGCGTTARSLNVPTSTAPPTTLPDPVTSVTPLPRTPATQAPLATLTMRYERFTPRILTVTPGTVIQVINSDGEMHSLVPAEYEEHTVRSSDVGPGNSAHMTAPDTPGEYHYSCFYHSWKAGEKGTIRVVADAAEAAAANSQAQQEESSTPFPTSTFTPTPNATATSTPTPTGTATSTPSF
ncbi:MAG: cupredoxin domain-containing protein [Sporichthyaceae bacterium]